MPKSAIPFTCRIGQLISIDEATRDTTTFSYNAFGNVERSLYRKWVSNQLVNNTEQTFSFTADHYLFTQSDRITTRSSNGNQSQEIKGYLYTYQNNKLQEVKLNNGLNNATIGYKQYTYEGDLLKTYTETDGNKSIIKRYTYDGTGKLMKLETPTSKISTVITNGRISQQVYPDSTINTYEYDSQGQLIKQITTFSGSRSQYMYTYDNNPYWTKTQLNQRGIPSPDLGEGIQVHNLKTSTFQRYLNDKLILEQKLTYNHAYNKQGYSQGFGRSDGFRQVNYYTNCP
ncbi:hypothetical protein GCM10028773_58520 [Spirosoma koreense]